MYFWPFFVFSIFIKKVPFLLPASQGFCLGQGAYQDLQGLAMGLCISIVSIGTLSSNWLHRLEQPLSVHRSQPVVSCPLPFYRLQLSPQVSQPLSRRILAQSNSSGSKRRYHCQPSFLLGLSWLLLLFYYSSQVRLLTSFIFPARQILISLQMPVLSPDQLLLLSYFGESHHPEKCPTGNG